MLKLKNVSKYYYQDGVIAQGFTKVNLELHIGEFVVITGESGSGKSTLLNVLSGLDTYEDGEMFINGEETSHYTEEDFLEYRRKYVSNIFQNFNLVNSYTVYENIELALLMNGKNRKEVKSLVNDLIEKVGLTKYKNTVTSKLSGGQKQRVAIARALANDTPIIVADEPTGSLDSKSSSEILKLLHEIAKEKLVIVVTHNKKEIEEYATRLIRMHDGKILENKVLQKINLDAELETKKVKNITSISKLRLGIRNTFNLPVKFILMFIIFLLISITLISNYAAFKMAEYEESNTSYSPYFMDSSDKRIIITKKDKSLISELDYQTIANMDNVDYIVKDDLINDYEVYLNNEHMYLGGKISASKVTEVDVGGLPKNDNEIVIKGSINNWYIDEIANNWLNKMFSLEGFSNYQNNIKIVGIIYDDNDYNLEFYLTDKILNDIMISLTESHSTIEFVLNNNYFDYMGYGPYLNIEISDKVQKGEIYVKDTLSMYCKNFNCLNNEFTINVDNLYYQDDLTLKIKNVYDKDNTKKILNEDYEKLDEVIYLNEEDYNYLFNKGNYQSSVFIKDVQELDNAVNELNDLGFDTLKIREAKYDDAEMVKQILNIFKLIVTIVLIITLFFITYFIIRIIYKSRNSYYTTLRTLGSTKKVCINILMKELICHATIAYTTFLIFIYLVCKDVIKFNYFKELANYIGLTEYVFVYLILILLSILMSFRYGRKIFKDSIIKTYGERI